MKLIKIRFVLLLFLLVEAVMLNGLEYPFRSISKNDGLPSPVVLCLYQDSGGFVWMGTPNGLCRFDGQTIKVFAKDDGLPSNCIDSILEDTRGKLWLGTDGGGLSCFDGKRFINYGQEAGLPGNQILCMEFTPDGTLWAGTERGLCRFDGQRFHVFTTRDGLTSNVINHLASDSRGNLWIATSRGLCRWEKGKFEMYSNFMGTQGLPVISLEIDPGGNPWFGTKEGVYHLRDGLLRKFTTADGLIHNEALCILAEKTGRVWIGTRYGVSLYWGGKFVSIDNKNGLPHGYIYSILRDAEGNMWFGHNNGVCYLSSLNVSLLTTKQGLPHNMVNTIARDKDGRLWIGTLEGLARFDGNSVKTYTTADGLLFNTITHIEPDSRGGIWVSTVKGISVIREKENKITNYTRQDGLASQIVYVAHEARDNTVWIGNRRGLNRFYNGRIHPSPPLDKQYYMITAILETRAGRLLFSAKNRLYAMPETGRIPERYDEKRGLETGVILSLLEDTGGTVWAASENGLGAIKNRQCRTYTTQDGLPDNLCYFCVEDRDGHLWIGTEKGLTRFDGQRFNTYSSPSRELETGTWTSGIITRSGTPWFGSSRGAVTFRLPPYPVNTLPPPIHITGVKLLEKEVRVSAIRELDYKQNYIRFDFTGISFSAPHRVTYYYRLEGMEDQWHRTRDNSIFYPFLPPGDYTFSVKAVNSDGIHSEQPAKVPFTIHPPFWRTWWFQALILVSVFALVLGFFLRRAQRAREKAELEAKNKQLLLAQRMELMGLLASGAVHDLKNLLAVIVAYSREMEYEFSASETSSEYVGIIKETAETAARMTKQILAFSKLKDGAPGNADLGQLLNTMLESLKPSFPTAVQTRWELPSGPVYFRIDPPWFQQIMLNLCLNAVHAMPGGGTLTVSLSGGKNIVIRVSDTGTGIEPGHLDKIFEPLFTTKDADKGTGLGLFVVKQIVEQHGGVIAVESEKGTGTAFTITFGVD